MENVLANVAAVISIGTIIFTSFKWFRKKVARIKIENSVHDRTGMQILCFKTGQWNSTVASPSGEVDLDSEYAGKVTEIGIYTNDKRTLLHRTSVDFTNGTKFLAICF